MEDAHLDIGEVRLEGVGAWVAGVEEHELGFLQMTGRQSFLSVRMRPVKAFPPRCCVDNPLGWLMSMQT